MSLFDTLIPARHRPDARRENSSVNAEPTVKPVYEINETPEAYGVTVYLPGIARDDVEILAEAGQFVVRGRRSWKQPEGWTTLYRETPDANFELVLTHDNAIDADKIVAELRDGVLRVSLPKAEALKPRKITVS